MRAEGGPSETIDSVPEGRRRAALRVGVSAADAPGDDVLRQAELLDSCSRRERAAGAAGSSSSHRSDRANVLGFFALATRRDVELDPLPLVE
jgi:hypothetical protein